MEETLDLPFGQLIDLINIYSITHGLAKEKNALSDEDIIPDIL